MKSIIRGLIRFKAAVKGFYRCRAILVTLAILAGGHAQAEPAACQIAPITSGPVAGRAGTITFPDGRKITIVGHAHGETNSILDLQALVSDVDSNKDTFLSEMKGRLKVVAATVEDFKKDRDYLLSRLEANNIQFVALEAGDYILKTINERTMIMWLDGKAALERRQINDSELFADTILAYGGPARYVKLTHPEYRESFRIVGVENDQLMQQSLDAQDESARQMNMLLKSLPNEHPFRKVATNMFLNATYNYKQLLDYSEEQSIKGIQSLAPVNVREKIPAYLRALLKYARLLYERDQQTMPKLLENEGSGVYFVGFAHLTSQQDLLKEACLKRQLRPSLDSNQTVR